MCSPPVCMYGQRAVRTCDPVRGCLQRSNLDDHGKIAFRPSWMGQKRDSEALLGWPSGCFDMKLERNIRLVVLEMIHSGSNPSLIVLLHLFPSAIFYPGSVCVSAAKTVIVWVSVMPCVPSYVAQR